MSSDGQRSPLTDQLLTAWEEDVEPVVKDEDIRAGMYIGMSRLYYRRLQSEYEEYQRTIGEETFAEQLSGNSGSYGALNQGEQRLIKTIQETLVDLLEESSIPPRALVGAYREVVERKTEEFAGESNANDLQTLD